MDNLIPYLHTVKEFSDWINGNQKWVQLYPYDTWSHPLWSDTTINHDVAEKMVKNFDARVMGRDLVVEYDHGLDKAKGGKAAGKLLKTEARDNGLWGLVEFNDIAKQEIDNGEWYYWSASHYDSWEHPQTHETHEYVLENPSLTNRPYVRGMVPLNHSEIVLEPEVLKEHAVWTTAYVNNLADSCFLYIESGGKKDAQGRTVPRSLRHLPYKDSSGNIDLPHLRNAIARIPQMVGISQATKDSLQAKAQNLLKQHGDVILDEVEEEVDDNEFQGELRKLLGVGDDVDLLAHVKEINEEITPLRELKKHHEQKKQFSEQWPDEAKRLEELEARTRDNFAKEFSQTFVERRATRKVGTGDDAKDEATTLGLSGLAIEKIREHAKEFSEGKATFDGFKSVLDTILDDGIVDYGTKGSSREKEEQEEFDADRSTVGDIRKQFSDKVDEIMEQDKITEYRTAYALAAEKYPDLFEAYKTRKPVVHTA